MAICPKCGSKEAEPVPLEKGIQYKCKKCGYVGPLISGFD